MNDTNEDFVPDSDVMYLTTSLEPVLFVEAYEWEDEDVDDVFGSV